MTPPRSQGETVALGEHRLFMAARRLGGAVMVGRLLLNPAGHALASGHLGSV
jgi:hypothetical protein